MLVERKVTFDIPCPCCKRKGKSGAYACASCERLICDKCFETGHRQVICKDCRAKGVTQVTPNQDPLDQFLARGGGR